MSLRWIKAVTGCALSLLAFAAPAGAAVVVSTDNPAGRLVATAGDSESDEISITATPDPAGPDHYTVTDSEGVTTADGDCPTVNSPNEIVCNLDAQRVEVDAGQGADAITLGTGAPLDTVVAWLIGGEGNDHLTGGPGDDSPVEYFFNYAPQQPPCSDYQSTSPGGLYGGNGDDDLTGGAGIDRLEGGPGDDALAGGNGIDDVSILVRTSDCFATVGGLFGGIGSDEMMAFDGGHDRVDCGDDVDSYVADAGIDTLLGCETNADSDADGVPAVSDSCPTLTGNSASGCPPAARSLTLGYSAKKRTFKGKVASVTAECIEDVVVAILRQRSSGDVEIGRTATGPTGTYKLRKRAKSGKYYARGAADVLPHVAECAAAVSPTRRVR